MNVKDKNSKAYKKSRRQKALAYGASVRAAHRKRKADEAALRQEYRAEYPTPKGKGLRVKRKIAMMVLEDYKVNGNVIDMKAGCEIMFGEYGPAFVDFVLKNRDHILETPHIHSYAFEVTGGAQ